MYPSANAPPTNVALELSSSQRQTQWIVKLDGIGIGIGIVKSISIRLTH